MLAAGDTLELIVKAYPWLEPQDIQACLVYARRVVGNERVEPFMVDSFDRAQALYWRGSPGD